MDDRYHLGHFFVELMKKDPDAIAQIDAATGEQETRSSLLSRSVALATSLRRAGFVPGDVLALGGLHHLNLHLPFFAALMNGLPILGVDPYFKYKELKSLFEIAKPKIVFCQLTNYEYHVQAVNDLQLDCKIVTFDHGENSLEKFIEKYNDGESMDDFEVATFDLDAHYSWLVSTSGSTGTPKVAALKHKVVTAAIKQILLISVEKCELSLLNVSPQNWISGYFNAIGTFAWNLIKLQSSRSNDIEHLIDVINERKPSALVCTPPFLSSILKSKKHCDLTCFETIAVAGGKATNELMEKVTAKCKNPGVVRAAYGLTETMGPVLQTDSSGPLNSVGKPLPTGIVKLVDPENGKEITEPNVIGEMWFKGPLFTEYLNNPEETAKVFTDDGFFKTGDLLYKDENGYYFFVSRLKMLIKYRVTHILPSEIEDVILEHPGVEEVAVTSIPHEEDGERPVAVVVRKPGCDVTAAEIGTIVASKLSHNKQLTGGIVFVEKLPLTSVGKISKQKLEEIVLTEKRESVL